MLKKYEKEFSDIFSRLMHLELTLRERVLYSTEKIFGDNTYLEYRNFFINPYVYEQYDTKNQGNKIQKIIKDKTVPNKHIKFIKLINSLYLSHLLDFVMTHKQFYQNKKLKELLYVNMPHSNQDFKILSKKRILIRNLRNSVVHFNFENYENNREIYLEALNLFEFHLGVNLGLPI